jgi:isopentenyl-diphosphate delta-isomerase
MASEEVILVNENDEALGTMEKMEAHQKGVLHRAFSIFIYNSQGEMLLQRRALNKYHSGGLWTNTCCSHPKAGESIEEAAKRRLMEEMGMACELQPKFNFIYKSILDHGMTEHELDHVMIGTTDASPNINPEEVAEYSYVSVDEIVEDLKNQPEKYTSWFTICLQKVLHYNTQGG